jgi:hypothetical protein
MGASPCIPGPKRAPPPVLRPREQSRPRRRKKTGGHSSFLNGSKGRCEEGRGMDEGRPGPRTNNRKTTQDRQSHLRGFERPRAGLQPARSRLGHRPDRDDGPTDRPGPRPEPDRAHLSGGREPEPRPGPMRGCERIDYGVRNTESGWEQRAATRGSASPHSALRTFQSDPFTNSERSGRDGALSISPPAGTMDPVARPPSLTAVRPRPHAPVEASVRPER